MTLEEYGRRLNHLLKQENQKGILSNDALEEADCLDHYYGAEGKADYAFCADLCKQLGLKGVVDIGSAFGYQSDEFVVRGLHYHGIDDWCDHFWNQEHPLVTGQTSRYPCEITIDKDGYLGVSRLCVGYFIKDYDAIARDFDWFLLICATDEAVEELSKRYEVVEKLDSIWSDGIRHTDKILFKKKGV